MNVKMLAAVVIFSCLFTSFAMAATSAKKVDDMMSSGAMSGTGNSMSDNVGGMSGANSMSGTNGMSGSGMSGTNGMSGNGMSGNGMNDSTNNMNNNGMSGSNSMNNSDDGSADTATGDSDY
jgi:hypothetical protein